MQAPAMGRMAGIVVWTLETGHIPAPDWEWLATLLDDAERGRAARFVRERDQRARVAGHGLKRLMLQAFAGAPAASWRFEAAPGAKPRVAGFGMPYFSLAYSAGRVACGLSHAADLGIDLEHTACQAPLALAGTCLTAEEEAWLRGLPEPGQSDGFLRLWTLKEAFTKASGTGLMQDLQDFGFGFDPLRVTFRHAGLGDRGSWHFDQRRIADAYLLAVAWRDGVRGLGVTVQDVPPETLRPGAILRASGGSPGPAGAAWPQGPADRRREAPSSPVPEPPRSRP